MLNEKNITAFLHDRASAILFIAVACVMACIAYSGGAIVPWTGNMGIGFQSANSWMAPGITSLVISLAVNVGVAMLTIYINRAFNILRSLTALIAGIYILMQVAMPSVIGQFYGGTLMIVVMLLSTALLFTTFGNPYCQRRIFLIFCMLSAATFTQISYALYLPVFLIGCAQMRILNLKTVIAAILGIITPPWILLGFGIITPDRIELPAMVQAWSLFNTTEMAQALTVSGFTIVCATVFIVINLLKILSYNSRVRAYNGFLTLLLIFTELFTIVHFNNFSFYIPLLNCLTAYQIAHFFTYRRTRRSYIPILLLAAAYIAFYLWAILY